jgi:hypothetical protein
MDVRLAHGRGIGASGHARVCGCHQHSTNTLTPPAFAPDPGSALIRVPLVRSCPLPYHYQKAEAAHEETPHAMREPKSADAHF